MIEQPIAAPTDSNIPVREAKRFELESRSYEFVPLDERYGTVKDQRKFWFMANASLITVLSGGVGHLFGVGVGWTIVAIVVGSVAGTIFQALHAAQGPVMGIPQMIQSRVQFGSRGALLPLLIAVIVLLGFPLFGIQAGASALSQVSSLNGTWSLILVAIVAVVVAVFGYRLVVYTEKIVAYVAVANFIVLTVAIFVVVPWGTAFAGAWRFSGPGLLAQIGASAILQLGIAPLVSDYTRYLPRKTSVLQITSAVFGGTLISAVWLSVLGAIVVNALPTGDVISSIRHIGDHFGFGLGTITLIVAVPASLLGATTGIYSCCVSVLTGAEAFKHFSTTKRLRALVIIVLGVVILGAGLLLPPDLVASFGNFLTILGYFLIPWTAINLIDFYVVRRGIYSITDILDSNGGIYGRWSGRGLISYAIGFLAMVPFFSTSIFEGPVAKALGGADLSFAVGLLVSCGSYLIFMRRFNRSRYLSEVELAPLNTLLH